MTTGCPTASWLVVTRLKGWLAHAHIPKPVVIE